jgi:uncharacterized membrane protein YbhN (UPF0104 family)
MTAMTAAPRIATSVSVRDERSSEARMTTVLLPRFVDYAQVLASLQALTPAQIAVVFALGFVTWVGSGAVQAALLPGLGLRHSTVSWLAGQGVANTIPGPVDLAVRYILYRQWGHPPVPSSLSIVLAGVFDQLAALSMPVVCQLRARRPRVPRRP